MQAGESDAVSQHEILKCWRATAGQAKNKVRRQGKKEGSHVSKKSPRGAAERFSLQNIPDQPYA